MIVFTFCSLCFVRLWLFQALVSAVAANSFLAIPPHTHQPPSIGRLDVPKYMVADMVAITMADIEVHMVANMVADMVADVVADI